MVERKPNSEQSEHESNHVSGQLEEGLFELLDELAENDEFLDRVADSKLS